MVMDASGALSTSRTLAQKGQLHESLAVLLRQRELLRNGPTAASRGSQQALHALASRIDPLLGEFRGSVFAALGVPQSAGASDVKKAYHRLILRYHPDKSSGTTELFTSVQEAYERFQKGEHLDKHGRPHKGGKSQRKSQFAERYERYERSSAAPRAARSAKPAKPAKRPLQMPQRLGMESCTSTSITLSWEAPQGCSAGSVSCYELQFKEGDERDWSVASNTLSRTTVQKHNLRPGTAYRFRVRALGAQTGEWSPFCGTFTSATMASVPLRPRMLGVKTKPNLGLFEATWGSMGRDVQYVLEWRESSSGGDSGDGGDSDGRTSQRWNRLEPANAHEAASCTRVIKQVALTAFIQCRVRASNGIGSGPWSAPMASNNQAAAAAAASAAAAKTKAQGNDKNDKSFPRRTLHIVREKRRPCKAGTAGAAPPLPLPFVNWSTRDARFEVDVN